MSEDQSPAPLILEQDTIYVISDLHLGDGTRSDLFSLGDAMTKRDQLRALLQEVNNNDGHLVIAGDLLDLQQGWSIDRVVTANAILLRELSDLGKAGRLTYIWSELDDDLSYYRELLNIQVTHAIHIPKANQPEDDPTIWAQIVQGHTFNPLIQSTKSNPKRLRTLHHLTERLLGTWMRFPLENFQTLENRMVFWGIHKLSWLAQDWEEATGWKKTLHEMSQQAYANQIGDAGRVWSNLQAQVMNNLDITPEVTITGHSHVPGIIPIANTNKSYINTGSWTFDNHTVCKIDRQQHRIDLFDWASKTPITDEAYRHLLVDTPAAQALRTGRFQHWWQQHYLGWLKFNLPLTPIATNEPIATIEPSESSTPQ